MAVETWGVDATLVNQAMPNEVPASLSATGNINSTNLPVLIKKAAARVNGVITSGMNGAAITDIAADATSDAYSNIQDAILTVLRPKILHAAYGSEMTEQVERDQDAANALLFRIERNPGLLGLGATIADDAAGQVYTSTQYYDLDTSAEAQKARRNFDGNPSSTSHGRQPPWW